MDSDDLDESSPSLRETCFMKQGMSAIFALLKLL